MKKASIFFAILWFTLAGFTSYSQAPAITIFSPTSGPVGTLVTITGTNLTSPTAFSIGGTAAIEVSNNGTTLVGLVMPGAVTGPVSITTIGGTDTGSVDFIVTPTPYPSQQQGNKLVGTGAAGFARQGSSISISADGNTAILGGDGNIIGTSAGAAWIFTRSGGIWIQQGNKLVGTGAVGGANQGSSISISADGNTAIVGGIGDDSRIGAAWIFTRSGGTWTQQGNKLVGTGAVGNSSQGTSVAISKDGNTAIVGGQNDNSDTGAAWIFTRSNGIWTQQGNKLVGTGAVGPDVFQGSSVAISADGNTAIVGGNGDNTYVGATWVYTRSDTTWTQQGNKLVSTGPDLVEEGSAVSLSADGNTAMVGAAQGAWVFTRTGGIWTQQGTYLIGSGTTLNSFFGLSLSLSADGNTAIVGGKGDSSDIGAAWIFTRSGGTWTQQGGQLIGTGAVGPAFQGSSVSISADGTTAIVGGFFDNNEAGAAWIYTSVSLKPQGSLTANGPFCNSGTGQLTWAATGGTGPFTIVYNDGTANRTVTNVVSGTPFNVFTEPVMANTTFTVVSVTDLNGAVSLGGFIKDSATIVVTDVSAGIISASLDSVCQDFVSQLTSNGLSDGLLQWQSSNTGSNFMDINNADSSVYNTPPLLQTTDYRLVVTNGSCADTSAPFTVIVNPPVIPPVLSTTDSLICASDSTLITTSGSYFSYLWNTGDTTSYIYANAAGGYWVTVTDANGCSVISDHQNISIYPVPSVSIIVQGDTLSSYGEVKYQWILNRNPILNATGSVFVANQQGSYSVEVTDSNGCTAISSTVAITGIRELTEEGSILLYPNPSVSNWQLAVDNSLVGSAFEIYDDNGRLEFQSVIRNPKSEINLNVAKGIYWLRISSANVSIVRKLIKI